MDKTFNNITFKSDIDCNVNCKEKKHILGADVYEFCIEWNGKEVCENTQIHFLMLCDAVRDMYCWHPDCGYNRSIPHSWMAANKTMQSISAPVACVYDALGNNSFTCAISEVKEEVRVKVGILNDSYFCMDISIKLKQYSKTKVNLKLYIDRNNISMSQSIDNVRCWWENDCNLKPMAVFKNAKEAMYSTWYSFQQNINQKDVLNEAYEASKLGLKSIIIDDGWQMEQVNARFAYCGDWEICEKKFPDFKGMVEKIHSYDMKVILWVGIPYVGEKSKLWDSFKDKTLQYSDWARASILDPRYPEVREHIIGALKRIMSEYNPDGFKLDFIDLFYAVKDFDFSQGMDISSVQQAVDTLMSEIVSELSKINPELLIEFRQKYIGPNMRKYGNLLRVTDCPDNYLANKVGVIDLRLMSGNTAVHSDMLIWNENESVEIAALQIINIIFGTMQFSVRAGNLSAEHRKMVKFWIEFMNSHIDLLQNSKIMVEEPQYLYTSARTQKNKESVIVAYSNNKVLDLDYDVDKNIIINGTQSQSIYLKTSKTAVYEYKIQNCCGECVEEGTLLLREGIKEIKMPESGLITLNK